MSLLSYILKNYDDDEYVYLIDNEFSWFASLSPCSKRKKIFKDDKPLTEGYVKDLKLINNFMDLEEYIENKSMFLSKRGK